MSASMDDLRAAARSFPTDGPESDGTLEWTSTTLVLVEARAAGERGLGYTYGHAALVPLIESLLADVVRGRDASAVPEIWEAMRAAVRNLGRPGLCSMAIAAVDTALWDLKARLLGLPLVELLGRVRDAAPVYASGGFTSYSLPRLRRQLAGWVEQGHTRVKIKIGREPGQDLDRVRAAREVIGPAAQLFVDANGAYDRPRAIRMAERMGELDVAWFEEPVSSDDLEGLRQVRARAPAGMAVAAGEYGYDLPYFRRMLDAEAVDVLQADVTRCAGFTEFLRVGALCADRGVGLSAHTAPALHLPLGCALPAVVHLEDFHDHVRIESALFEGAPAAADGLLRPALDRPGLGLALKEDACFAAPSPPRS